MSRSLRLFILGAAAGLVASWAMEEAQNALAQAGKAAGAKTPVGESSTIVAANRISLAVTGYPVAEAKREQAGRIVHYVTGAALGAIYTMFADRMRLITTGFGGLFALGVAAVLDEGLAPRLGLSPPAAEIPLERHVEGVAAHLVYGAALETSRQVLTILA